jgi:FAD/FMN-containing dehydrogenase
VTIDIKQTVTSWGRFPTESSSQIFKLSPFLNEPKTWGSAFLPYGNGRSYGDVCLNSNHSIIQTRNCNKLISFDKQKGILTAEAGILFSEILEVIVPAGFFIPVTPGTKFVTLGGAIANDVHGKNHHLRGTFGNHVIRLSLLRSNGEILECSNELNTDFFHATIAGIGLTGIILNATIQLIPIQSSMIEQETIKFYNLSEFFEISKSSKDIEYTVAWVDCVKIGKDLGRGHFIRGDFSQNNKDFLIGGDPKLNVPFNFPNFALNKFTVKAFNELYFNKQSKKLKKSLVHYEPFFYPLDIAHNWNRLYGKRGFVQFQTVVPVTAGYDVITEIFKVAAESGLGSFLAVLKEFGDLKSPGMLSFPRPGVTLCLDFPMIPDKTITLMKKLEDITFAANGALYPAKDALMRSHSYRAMYPNFEEFSKFIDPNCSSSFYRRVVG